MSLMELSGSRGACTSKHYKMKQLVSAIEEYFQTKREDTAMTINMHLQNLSVTIDLSVFDPHNNIASQFFVSLYELMNKMEERSVFAWSCVDVLSNACRNPAARHALIHTYQFIPSLSRLLSNQLSEEKKLRLLRLMQDLTCGIKISWQIPHLPHLMVTLSQWVESTNEDIVTLSLGILVNLCYKNLPAMYTLTGHVDIKRILHVCSSLKSSTIEIHTCKLLIILDYMNGDIPKTILAKTVSVTFDSITEAFKARDSILMRQIVEFFLDVGKQNSLELLIHNPVCDDKLKSLLELIENNVSMETNDSGCDTRDPDCIALVFEFFNYLIEIKLAATLETYPSMIKLALKWIHTDLVSTQALAVLKSVAVNVDQSQNEILEPLVHGLAIFLMTLDSWKSEESSSFMEQNKKTSGLLQLLKAMIQVPTIRPRVLEELKVETLCKVFGPLLGDGDSPRIRPNDPDVGNIDTINLYIHGLALVNELAKHDASWLNLQSNLMQHRQIHMVLAQGLYECSREGKLIIFEMSSNPCFPRKMIVEAMLSLQPLTASDTQKPSSRLHDDFNFPVLSVSQIKRIDDVLAKFEKIFAERQESTILTSDVIELYEYKLAAMGNAERAAMASVEAASERCTHLQHRNAQLTAELNRLHQLLYHVQQCHEQATQLKNSLLENVEELKGQVEADTARIKTYKNEIRTKEEDLCECQMALADLKKKYEKLMENKKDLEGQNEKLKQVVAKLEENSMKLEKTVQKKEEAYKKANQSIVGLSSRIDELEVAYKQKETELQQKIIEIREVTKELQTKKQILDTITKFAINSQATEQ